MRELNTGWDVAHLLMHDALVYLGASCNLNLETCHKYCDKIDTSNHVECFSLHNRINLASGEERKLSIKAIILFQAGMEAIISWAYSTTKLNTGKLPRNFSDRWVNAFLQLNSGFDFSQYSNFYSKYRNAIVHPDSDKKIKNASSIDSIITYEGIKNGWVAFEELSSLIEIPHDDNSWKIMCQVNNVPPDETVKNMKNLTACAGLAIKKHLDGFNSN